MKLKEVKVRKVQKAGDLDEIKNYKDGGINISNRKITSLEGCLTNIDGYFDCSRNHLTSLEGGPKEVTGPYNCNKNKLVSLKGCPIKMNYWFSCDNNQLSSFEHFPKHIGTVCHIGGNQFTSFKDIDQHIEFIGDCLQAINLHITSGFLDLFGINRLQKIEIDNKEIEKIVNRYIKEKDIINFQDEMIKAGYESYL